eukprot:CAMPEP_0178998548 /NCGR_PEP_ID=MMETSP0795-20121207/9570_1 /TAXON_ID=88552 /ORGANISM="Amoebophrya sp., Strain Ameob2" /LENGTH=60 /DNA_ID=CAMNT_0020691231 /DNA_START=453 /DNA_END=635 /DNA_ORIENTATION=+
MSPRKKVAPPPRRRGMVPPFGVAKRPQRRAASLLNGRGQSQLQSLGRLGTLAEETQTPFL